MIGPKTKEEAIVEWARGLKNPMFSVNGALRLLDNSAYGISSNSRRYVRVYRLLEKMTEKGILMCHGTKNGGNIYLLKERVK